MEKTNQCPHKLREGLPPLTERIARLRIDERGYPVPKFVQWLFEEGGKVRPAEPGEPGAKPDFRIVDPIHLRACVLADLCWVCGDKLGKHRAYLIGPMCAINHTSAEPPSHIDCAEWSAKGCPFLSRPNMVRREDELSEMAAQNVAGVMIKRNPGVTLVWHVTTRPQIRSDERGGLLFDVGHPESVKWFREGRTATADECIESINSGIENLLVVAEDGEERNEIMRRRDRLVASLRAAV